MSSKSILRTHPNLYAVFALKLYGVETMMNICLEEQKQYNLTYTYTSTALMGQRTITVACGGGYRVTRNFQHKEYLN